MRLLLIFIFLVSFVEGYPQRDCLILLDHYDNDNVGKSSVWFMISHLQAAALEKSVPILISTSLWNSFVERRLLYKEEIKDKHSPLSIVEELYQKIDETLNYWSKHYASLSDDITYNKFLSLQKVNQELYTPDNYASEESFQLLINYHTPFNKSEWQFYKNGKGFYLLLPKEYIQKYPDVGFRLDQLVKVEEYENPADIYFDVKRGESIVNSLEDFFVTNQHADYRWNIVLAGHGGSMYSEFNDSGSITWTAMPIIADLPVNEFNDLLVFFDKRVKTNYLHYFSCYAGGNHLSLLHNMPYSYTIGCSALTDCVTRCLSTNKLPSQTTPYLKSHDLYYDKKEEAWRLSIAPLYKWGAFFEGLRSLDFSIESIENFQNLLSFINHPILCNIPLLCLPGSRNFYPILDSNTAKIDNRIDISDSLLIRGIKTLLIKSEFIQPKVILDVEGPLRILSIKSGPAEHHFQELEFIHPVNIAEVFWQVPFQLYDKTFLIDTCYMTKDSKVDTLKNVLIMQQKSHYIRIFYTIDEESFMLVAHKTCEEDEMTIQEVSQLSAASKAQYEQLYFSKTYKKIPEGFK